MDLLTILLADTSSGVTTWMALGGMLITGLLVHNAPTWLQLATNRGDKLTLEAKNRIKEEELAARKAQIQELITSNKSLQEALKENNELRDAERKALKEENKKIIQDLRAEHKDYTKKLKGQIEELRLNNKELYMKYQIMQNTYQRAVIMVDAFMMSEKDNANMSEVLSYMNEALKAKKNEI